MANSLEVRVPFLDKTIVEFSNAIIPQFGIKHDRPKLILKDDLYQFIPIEKVNKTKKGFSIPIGQWLKHELKDDFITTVINRPFYGESHLNSLHLKQLVEDFYEEKNKVNPWGLWHLYAWQKWAIHNELI
jgi:asparagine synthase (glutamine-hydrolysing)